MELPKPLTPHDCDLRDLESYVKEGLPVDEMEEIAKLSDSWEDFDKAAQLALDHLNSEPPAGTEGGV